MPSAKVLLLGANGNISLEVQRQLSGNDSFSYFTISSDELNQLRESTKGLSCKVLELLADNPEFCKCESKLRNSITFVPRKSQVSYNWNCNGAIPKNVQLECLSPLKA